MKAFEIHLNGNRICTAGIDVGVLTATIVKCGTPPTSSGFPEFQLHVGALDTATNEDLAWKMTDLNMGDQITINIIDAHQVDPEQHRVKAKP